jgi:radical SAM protein with 4Fe4S-binding SPASM domain
MTDKPRIQSLIFEVTQHCNHVCMHCYNVWQGGGDYPRGELDTTRTLHLLTKALDETSCRHVTFTGGEPLLRSDLPLLLDYLYQRRVQTTIISNGRLLTESTAADLIGRGVGLFELPLLSHKRETHDQLSGAPGAWDAVLAAMANVRLHHGGVFAAFVITKLNVDHLYETMRLAFAFGARGVMLNRFNVGGRGRENAETLSPTVEQVRAALEVADAASVEFHLPVSCSIPIQPCLIDTSAFSHISFGYCSAGTERAYYALDPMGNVRPCNHTDLILGDLFEQSFPKLIASERMSDFVRAIPPFCSACNRRLECQGGCKAAAQVCYGSLTAEEPFLRNGSLEADRIKG